MPRPRTSLEQKIEALELIEAHGGNVAAASRASGIKRRTLCQRFAIARADEKLMATRGYAPKYNMTKTVPEPYIVKGVSTYYDKDGKVRGQWVKSTLDQERADEALREFIENLAEGIRGTSPEVSPPVVSNADLLAVYPMGDPHFGMYAWKEESGEDFDLEIAEQLLMGAIDRLVGSAPPAETALIIELGDFFHADNESNMTQRSGNPLDVDTRWAKVMQIGLRAMVYCVGKCLEKHKKVIVRIVRGNHDTHSSFALALALDAYFNNNARVKVDLSAAVHWFYRFGKVLIGATHGDTGKPKDLPAVMAADRPVDWGVTKFRYWYHGHIHHDNVDEYPGVKVESFRTLAAKDAYHAGHGYRAGRDMRCIVHHRLYGEIERHRCDVAEIQDRLVKQAEESEACKQDK